MENIIDSFNSKFDGNLAYESRVLELGKIHAFFILVENCYYLKESWREMRNFIALQFQNNLLNEFERWNTYIFFLVNKSIETELKYLIENDTFSSRKIVIEGNEDFSKILEEHILNNDIKITVSTKNENGFIPNPIFFDQVSGIEAKSKVTIEIKEAYSRIISKIKEVNHEI